MKISTFDIANNTGWTNIDDDSKIESGSKNFKQRAGQHVGIKFANASKFFDDHLDEYKPNIVFYEIVTFIGKNRSATQTYHGLVGILLAACHSRGINTKSYEVSDIKIAASGKGNATKETMIATAKRQFPDQVIRDDDQADALWILFLACRDLIENAPTHTEELF